MLSRVSMMAVTSSMSTTPLLSMSYKRKENFSLSISSKKSSKYNVVLNTEKAQVRSNQAYLENDQCSKIENSKVMSDSAFSDYPAI